MHESLYALAISGDVLYVAITVLLMRTYRRTRDVGFIWLGVAVLVWPLAARLLMFWLERVGAPEFATLLNVSQQVFSLVLLLVAVLYLGRQKQIDTRPA